MYTSDVFQNTVEFKEIIRKVLTQMNILITNTKLI